jgi:hypothetical protein
MDMNRKVGGVGGGGGGGVGKWWQSARSNKMCVKKTDFLHSRNFMLPRQIKGNSINDIIFFKVHNFF